MCPDNEEPAGKRRSGKIRKGSNWLCSMLTKSARHCALLAALPCVALRRLRGRRGSEKAAVTVGYSILAIAYHVLEREVPYEELGEGCFHR